LVLENVLRVDPLIPLPMGLDWNKSEIPALYSGNEKFDEYPGVAVS
jgi:hypothetical protein